jgi:hypothetical protein
LVFVTAKLNQFPTTAWTRLLLVLTEGTVWFTCNVTLHAQEPALLVAENMRGNTPTSTGWPETKPVFESSTRPVSQRQPENAVILAV